MALRKWLSAESSGWVSIARSKTGSREERKVLGSMVTGFRRGG